MYIITHMYIYQDLPTWKMQFKPDWPVLSLYRKSSILSVLLNVKQPAMFFKQQFKLQTESIYNYIKKTKAPNSQFKKPDEANFGW